jgi:hypothetical protein
MVRCVRVMLRSVVNDRQSDWTFHLAAYEFAYNNSAHPATGMTPFEVDTGTHRRTPYPVYRADGSDLDSAATFIEQLNALHNFALQMPEMTRQKQADAKNKGRSRSTTFQESQLVLLSSEHASPLFLKGPRSNKLRAKYIGPFAVTQQVSAPSYELDLPAHFNIHPVVSIEYLKPYHPSPDHFGPREMASMELPENLKSAVWQSKYSEVTERLGVEGNSYATGRSDLIMTTPGRSRKTLRTSSLRTGSNSTLTSYDEPGLPLKARARWPRGLRMLTDGSRGCTGTFEGPETAIPGSG